MKNLTRAQRKKVMKSFKVGDVVTWGSGAISHRVVEVTPRGVVVDVTSCALRDPDTKWWALQHADGTWRTLVLFDSNTPEKSLFNKHTELFVQRGPVRHSSDPPDKVKR